MPLFLDTETRSRTPIQRGNDLYTRDAECTIVTWARDERPATGWDVFDDPRMPAEFEDSVLDERVRLIAHNAAFDRGILLHSLKIETTMSRWWCTSACAASHGLPASLETLGLVLGLSAEQQKLAAEGHKLMQWFCIPRTDGEFRSPHEHPEKWAAFFRYAIRDTEALREIYKRLPTHNYRNENLALYHIDQMINERGFQFDDKLATAAQLFLKNAKVTTDKSMSDATGGVVGAATQRQRLLTYLQEKLGVEIANLRASEIREWLERDDLAPEVRFLLETRLEAAKSSGAKFGRGLSMQGVRGRIRHTTKFNGAGRTGRFSHKGFQPGNMARPELTVYVDE